MYKYDIIHFITLDRMNMVHNVLPITIFECNNLREVLTDEFLLFLFLCLIR